MDRPLNIYLYQAPANDFLQINDIADSLREKLPNTAVEIRDEFFAYSLGRRGRDRDTLSYRIASSRVADPRSSQGSIKPLPMEIAFEKKYLLQQEKKPAGILYDGGRLLRIYYDLLSPEERTLRVLHLVFTNQFVGTYDRGDRRFHVRVSIYGIPSLLSLSGAVEGPAKPKEYYLLKQELVSKGLTTELPDLRERFGSRILRPKDSRLTDVLKGYVMQALFYNCTGNPFCEDKNCRLYNAHWQEEMIHAQLLAPYEFCPCHQKMLDSLG